MDDRELDFALRAALAPDEVPSERVWARTRRPEPRWLPSLGELSLATLVGAAAVLWMSVPRSVEPARAVARRHDPIESTYLASTEMSTTLR